MELGVKYKNAFVVSSTTSFLLIVKERGIAAVAFQALLILHLRMIVDNLGQSL